VLNFLFRCDAAPDIGFGHVSRCLTLARYYQQNYDCRINFAIRRNDAVISKVRTEFQVLQSNENSSFAYLRWLEDCIEKTDANILILDVRDGLRAADLVNLKQKGVLVVSIDDPEEKRLGADILFYPPVPQVQEMDWFGFKGKLFSDWPYAIVSQKMDEQHMLTHGRQIELLISMGWSDPADLTLLALEAVEHIERTIDITLVIGGGFRSRDKIISIINASHHKIEVAEEPDSVISLLSASRLALVSFGVTAYEAAALYVPTILVCLTLDHAKAASAFHDTGIGLNTGVYSDLIPKKLGQLIEETLIDKKTLEQMSRSLQGLDCGNIQRLGDEIVDTFTSANDNGL
jgi:spore coat polysaccharide biosynthesis predicted glycosyltransferase SpsG